MNKLITHIIYGTVIGLLLWFHGCEVKNFREEINLQKAANDTLTKKKNKDGSQTATIALLQASNVKQLLELETKDKTIKYLQDEVKKNKNKIKDGGSVTTIESNTSYSATVLNDSTHYNKDSCNPVYYSSGKDTNWIKYSTVARRDSTTLNLKVKNAYTVVIGSERIGLFKRKPIVDVTNMNPYTDTQSLRAFEVKQKRNRFTLGLQGGYGVTLYGLSPYVGIGGQFTLF